MMVFTRLLKGFAMEPDEAQHYPLLLTQSHLNRYSQRHFLNQTISMPKDLFWCFPIALFCVAPFPFKVSDWHEKLSSPRFAGVSGVSMGSICTGITSIVELLSFASTAAMDRELF